MENSMKKYQVFIGNAWKDSASGESFQSYNPFTGDPWAEIPKCDARDVDEAVEAAHDVLYHGAWGKLSATERGALLRKLGDLVARDADSLTAVEVRDAQGQLVAKVHKTLYVRLKPRARQAT